MKKLLAFIFISALCAFANAQEGRLALFDGTSGYNFKSWYEINPSCWDITENFNFDEAFGVDKERFTSLGVEYRSATIYKGKKASGNAVAAVFEDRGPLFAGEGYNVITGVLPDNQHYTKSLCVLSGWVYNISKYVDFDIGGTLYFTEDAINADSRIAIDGGERFSGDIYVGFIGNHFLRPFVYGFYNFSFYQYGVMAGFAPSYNLEKLTAIKNLSLDIKIYASYAKAERFSAESTVGGKYWENSYGYIQAYGGLSWVLNKHIKFSGGVGYAVNNDGQGCRGPLGEDFGPDMNVYGTFSISYIF